MITIRTRTKIALARLACTCILSLRKLAGLSGHAVVSRRGITWDLDLREGIDFSIYLLGGFENRTLDLYKEVVRPGDTVLDIGANIGSHTLPLARLVGESGRVIACEPTRYAIGKMRATIALNPDLAPRITVLQYMLTADANAGLAPAIYSSWPLFGEEEALHRDHGGRLMETTGAATSTLDAVVQDLGIGKVDVIKIDVDGNEQSVLQGAAETLSRNRPLILMELAPYLFDPKSRSFESMIQGLAGLQYSLLDADTKKELPLDAGALRALIPAGATRNVLLQPDKRQGG